jgi:ribonuclease HI
VPWVKASLRGQKVYAKADSSGRLKVERGRVEIRYKTHDGRRYDAREDNLSVVDYADGACSGNPGPAGLGAVVIDGGQRVEISEYLGDTLTNNIAELTAVLRVLEEVDPSRPLVIHTDSQYTIGVVDKGWKAKANVALVEALREALRDRPHTHFVYVRGHAGIALNERADALAREAVQQRRSRRAAMKERPSKSPDDFD